MSYKKSLKYVTNLAKIVLVPLLAITVSVTAGDGPADEPGQYDGLGELFTQLDTEPLATLESNGEIEEPYEMYSGDQSQDTSVESIESLIFKKDTSIKDALRFLAAKYHKNIVPSPKVDGVITVTTLYDVTFEQALNVILGHTFRYEQDGNFIRVYTADEYVKIKQDPSRMTYRVFTLYYISAAEAIKLQQRYSRG